MKSLQSSTEIPCNLLHVSLINSRVFPQLILVFLYCNLQSNTAYLGNAWGSNQVVVPLKSGITESVSAMQLKEN